MKVLSFLEMTLFLNSDNDKKEQFELIKIMEHFGFSGIAPFYAQPFKPELITELFEGWVYDTEYECYSFGFNRLTSIYLKNAARTLDEFITDCQRAGIELIWRKK